MASKPNCLNCGSDITAFAYCPNCGQKSSTHRYSLQHFLVHDVVHGVWHIDRGLLYTLKELFVRPGHSVREYVQGKRMKHFNVVSTLLIVLAVSLFISSYSTVSMGEISAAWQNKGYLEIARKFYKYIIISALPLYALAGYCLFRKSRQNYSEYLVAYAYAVSALLLLGVVFPLITLVYTNREVLYYVKVITPLLSMVYIYWFHRQYFSAFGYSKKQLVWRSLLAVATFSLTNALINFTVSQIGLWLHA